MIFVTDPDRAFLVHLAKHLAPREVQGAESLAELEHALAIAPEEPGVIVYGPGLPLAEALESATWLQDRGSTVATLLLTEDVSADVLRAAIRAGVRDVLPRDVSADELGTAVDRSLGLAQRTAGGGGLAPEEGGKIITVFSTKGGCGKSVVASNLGILLARTTGESVCLVDLDLQSGDLAIMLQLTPAWTIYDACEDTTRLDGDALAGYLTSHRSGVPLLAAPLEPALAETISGAAVQEVLHLLASQFSYVIVDGPALFTDQVIAALDVSHEVVLLGSLDVPSIKNLKLALQTLGQLGIGRDRTHVVLNRADSKVGLRLQEVEKSLGTTVDVAIPSSRDVPLSVNQGTPLALESRRSPVVGSIQKLCERLRIPSASTTRAGRRAARGRR